MTTSILELAVLGGTGVSGREIVRELVATTACTIRLGARTLERAAAEAGRHDRERVRPYAVDYRDARALERFLGGAAVVVHAVGPSIEVEDRVARAALAARCHYLDIGGYDLLYDRMRPRTRELERTGLACTIGAGWMPGVSGVFPVYVDLLARGQLDRVERFALYYGARDHWGDAAARDMLWSVFQDWSGEFRYGRWKASRLFAGGRDVELPAPFGRTRALPFFDNQLRAFAEQRAYPQCGAYVAELDPLSAIVFAAARVCASPRSLTAARAVQWAIARHARRRGAAGVLHVVIEGERGGRQGRVTGTLIRTDNHRVTAIAAATAARFALAGELAHGTHHLCEAVDPVRFMAALRERGVHDDVRGWDGQRLAAAAIQTGRAIEWMQ